MTGSMSFTLSEIPSTAYQAWKIHSRDFDNDGDLDFFTGPNASSNISYYENDGSENFTLGFEIPTEVTPFDMSFHDLIIMDYLICW